MYQEEVYAQMKEDPYFAEYRPEQCLQDLTTLTECKNLNTIQDTRKVASIEEFKDERYVGERKGDAIYEQIRVERIKNDITDLSNWIWGSRTKDLQEWE